MTKNKSQAPPIPLKINTREFRIPQHFEKNNEFAVSFRADKRLVHVMKVMFEEVRKVMPWETISDFYRWAAWQGTLKISEVVASGRLANEVAQVKTLIEIIRDSEMQQYTVKGIGMLRKRVDELELDGDHDEVFQVLKKSLAAIEEMNPESFYGKKMRAEFKKYFSGYMQKGRINLRPSKAERES